jgi:hypothetical protein
MLETKRRNELLSFPFPISKLSSLPNICTCPKETITETFLRIGQFKNLANSLLVSHIEATNICLLICLKKICLLIRTTRIWPLQLPKIPDTRHDLDNSGYLAILAFFLTPDRCGIKGRPRLPYLALDKIPRGLYIYNRPKADMGYQISITPLSHCLLRNRIHTCAVASPSSG